ncbi:hypothetical protein AU359_01909 [Micrococcus luteus]|uniref:alginate lyase family protein n=1 Tax=Micrococcus luteus TaxID=1270 RepID=UPI0007938BFE|nr:alginate lyase family protein [Micrococcus luteus]KWW34451.1 hypothetical protein AU359_01909 [Micrococcus luteus]
MTAVERASLYPCRAYGQLQRFNTVETNARDVYGWRQFDPVAVGDGSGDIDWDRDPYQDEGWRLWLSSLKWIGPSIEAGREGDEEALGVAERVIRDWRADHEGGWGGDHDDAEANHHRMGVLLCFREVVADRAARSAELAEDGSLPEEYAWLDDLIGQHAAQNMARYSRRHNHGSMENLALLGAGCVLGRPDWMEHAMERAEGDIPFQVDDQGLSNEAAPHYAQFNYVLFQAIDETAAGCGVESGAFEDAVREMGQALPHMVDSTGSYWQYGDSAEFPVKPFEGMSDELRYAATNGAEGVASADRIRAFDSGPVFGRSSWGTPDDGFADAAAWMLRTGTGRETKSHRGDLMQFLYTARGRQIVEDGGHPGIVEDSWRPWGLGPTAHNVIHIPTLDEYPGAGPAERGDVWVSSDGSADGATARQKLEVGGERARSVLVLTAPDAAVIVDRTRILDGRTDHVVETLWNLPAEFSTERVSEDTVRAVDADSGESTTLVQVRLDGEPVSRGGVHLRRGETDVEGGHAHHGWHYPAEQEREEATQVAFRSSGAESAIVSVLVPAAAGDAVRVDSENAPDGSVILTIRSEDGHARVAVQQDGTLSRLT